MNLHLRALAAAVLVALGFACAPRAAAPDGPLDPALEVEALEATRLDRPLHIVFDWRARERDATFSGRGVARVEPPDRVRLDLFGPRGEQVLAAAMIGEDLRLPGEPGVRLPPPPLFWSALGVLQPPGGAELAVATRDSRRLRLEYVEDAGRWRFVLEDGRMRQAEWDSRRAGRHTVQLQGELSPGVPRQATYRDWDEFFELILTVTDVEEAESFPGDIWWPGAR